MKANDVISAKKDFINEHFEMKLIDSIDYNDLWGIGIEVIGTMKLKKYVDLKEFPFKIFSIKGDLILENCGFTSLKNFPQFTLGTVFLNDNLDLVSLKMDRPVSCLQLHAQNCGIKDFSDADFAGSMNTLNLSGCKNLESLKGLGQQVHIYKLILHDCDNFKEDISVYNISQVFADFQKNPKPFLFALLNGRPTIDDTSKMASDKFKQIVNKYRGKTSKEIFNLIRELRDSGDIPKSSL